MAAYFHEVSHAIEKYFLKKFSATADMAVVFTPSSFPSHSRLHLSPGFNKTGLNDSGLETSDQIFCCDVVACHGKQLRIVASQPVESGTAVSVEHEDALLLGEVYRSLKQDGRWQIDIRVEQALNGLMNLMALRSRLLMEELQAKQPISA